MHLLNHHFVVSKKCATKFWAIFKFFALAASHQNFLTLPWSPSRFCCVGFVKKSPTTNKNKIQRNLDRHPLVMVNTLQSAYSFSRSVGSLKNFHDLLQAIDTVLFPQKNQPLPWRVRATYASQCPQRSRRPLNNSEIRIYQNRRSLKIMPKYMDVYKNSGFSPQIIHFNGDFHYKQSILGYHYFWKHPYHQK